MISTRLKTLSLLLQDVSNQGSMIFVFLCAISILRHLVENIVMFVFAFGDNSKTFRYKLFLLKQSNYFD